MGMGGWVTRLSIRLEFGSGHDLMVHEIKPHVGLCSYALTEGSLLGFLSLSLLLSACPPLMFSLSQDK